MHNCMMSEHHTKELASIVLPWPPKIKKNSDQLMLQVPKDLKNLEQICYKYCVCVITKLTLNLVNCLWYINLFLRTLIWLKTFFLCLKQDKIIIVSLLNNYYDLQPLFRDNIIQAYFSDNYWQHCYVSLWVRFKVHSVTCFIISLVIINCLH